MKPVLEDEAKLPRSRTWLGKLGINSHNPANIYISAIVLNQPGELSRLRLGSYHRSDENDGKYTANPQAMNFISLVEDYLNQFEKRRLAVVNS